MALGVILDMDGLMLDTEPIARRAWQQAGLQLGYDLTDDLFVHMVGRNNRTSREVVRRHFGPGCPADAIADRAAELYLEQLDTNDVPHKTGLLTFLCFLEERQVPKAVATSTATALARHKLQRAGVAGYFDVVIGGDQVEHGKPAPDIFLAAARGLNERPQDCVVLEDSEPGLQAAKAAGMKSILIPDSAPPGVDARQSAFAIVTSLLAAIGIVDTLLGSRSG